MTRRTVTRVLLALVLLLSQQMAIEHVLSHLAGARGASASALDARSATLSKSVAQDQNCSQCLAFAQIASAVGSLPRSFAPASPGAGPVASRPAAPPGARSLLAFRSRAPPVSA